MSESQRALTMSVFIEEWLPNAQYRHDHSHAALWLQSGNVSGQRGNKDKDKDKDNIVETGTGIYPDADNCLVNTAADTAVMLRFTIGTDTEAQPVGNSSNDQPLIQSQLVLSCEIKTPLAEGVLRLDQVDFPPAAVAYRHTHPGAGIRYLVHGGLQVDSTHGVQNMQPGQAWFEDANTPVKATAAESAPTRFVRFMLLPVEYEGQPTLTLLNEDDRDKPRLQTNTRHFDRRVSFSN